ncbi:MAG: hypothetical protein JW893_00730 [Candidatus Omnitrophica bacterium]|nr:hypothetical protein [Candidatus Omnitrophota bacterium]
MKRNIIITTLLATLALVVSEFLFVHEHAVFWWQKILGNHALIGLLGGIALMFLAKGLGQFFLYRKEDYYDRHAS